MARDMAMVLGGVLLPKPNTFVLEDDDGGTDILTLGRVLYTDFRDRRRTWTVGWENLLYENDFESIQTLYHNQVSSGSYPVLQFDAYGIYAPVKIKINPQRIALNGTLVKNFVVTLIEKNPVS